MKNRSVDDVSVEPVAPHRFCSAAGLIRETRAKTPYDIRQGMSGNLCRCGAYPHIVAAIEQVIQANENEEKER